MTHQSAGAFDVKMTPQPADATAAGQTIGRILLVLGVVPDSGTGELVGLSGNMEIISAGVSIVTGLITLLPGRSGMRAISGREIGRHQSAGVGAVAEHSRFEVTCAPVDRKTCDLVKTPANR